MMETPPFPEICPVPGDRATHPRDGIFSRPLLPELDDGARSFAGNNKGCRVGGGVARSHGRGGSGGARESRRPAGHAKMEIFLEIQNGGITIFTTTSTEAY